MRIFLTITLASSLMFFASCAQTTKNYWKTTKHYYYEYLNKPATLDSSESSYTSGEEVLATNLPPVENVLNHFKRTLFNLDSAPTDEWMNSFIARFPWVGGVALVDTDGKVLHEWPTAYVKQLDYSFIKDRNKKIAPRHLIGNVKDDALGPEVYVATEVMQRAKPLGYFVAHFDPRVLFSNVEGSSEFMVAAPGAILWPGKYEASTTPLSGANWAKLTDSDTSGSVKNAAGSFVWYSYYLGTMPIVFAAPDVGTFPEAAGQMDKLASYRSAGASSETISTAITQESLGREPGDHNVVTPPRKTGQNATSRHERDLTEQENPESAQTKNALLERKKAKAVREANATSGATSGSTSGNVSKEAGSIGTTSGATSGSTANGTNPKEGSATKGSSVNVKSAPVSSGNSTTKEGPKEQVKEPVKEGAKESGESGASKTAPATAPKGAPAVPVNPSATPPAATVTPSATSASPSGNPASSPAASPSGNPAASPSGNPAASPSGNPAGNPAAGQNSTSSGAK